MSDKDKLLRAICKDELRANKYFIKYTLKLTEAGHLGNVASNTIIESAEKRKDWLEKQINRIDGIK